ncbi:metallophosphoesterase family protein [Burkholderia alba]|uniref:metallophosphoesterase family protein n=1 Tax=Burkholderia alba TaxID=2683677 RepID=UPI002B057776|nr:metallophosphoesterase [Burkholderia alba]
MKPIEHFEAPHLALWKSCVAEVLARSLDAERDPAAAIDCGHPLIDATDRYCRALHDNLPLDPPAADSDDEAAVQTYLSYLHHRRAHARIAGAADIERDLEQQTQQYKFGNPLWQQMYVQYYKYYWQYPFHKGGEPQYRSWQAPGPGNGDPGYGVIDWRLPPRARIAIVGDIGTGTDVAAAVLVAALKFEPDAILHLGDVYFSGTHFETEHRLVGLVRSVMRSEKRRVPFFTVPGNHEYFTGAVAYLQALDSGALIDQPSQRQAASYFCLRSADDGWQFLGLDTGYHGHYMNVAASAQQATLERLHIGPVETAGAAASPHWPADVNPYFRHASLADLPRRDTTAPDDQVFVRPDEAAWHLDKLARFPGRSILLSHHPLYSALDVCGIAQRPLAGSNAPDPADFNRAWVDTALWRQFGAAFGNRVAAWIWGHEHNLGIFADGYRPADWPTGAGDATEIFKTLPKGRCAGHSAIPVQASEAPYAQKFPVPLQRPELTLGLTDGWYNRGFQLLELAGAGQPARLSYFQIEGADPAPLPIYVESIA